MSYNPELWKDFPTSEQECFDRVAKHMLTQNCKSVDLCGECMYRGSDGTKCAAGCLIPDEAYSDKFENEAWYNLAAFGEVPCTFSKLISELQRVHDQVNAPDWPFALKDTAENFELKWNFEKENLNG